MPISVAYPRPHFSFSLPLPQLPVPPQPRPRVAPPVVALRAKAASVVDAELARLERRLGDLDPKMRQEIAKSMTRIADKLLHGPTVRVKELAGSPGAESYETALRVLFELDPNTVQSVGRPDDDMLAWPVQESET